MRNSVSGCALTSEPVRGPGRSSSRCGRVFLRSVPLLLQTSVTQLTLWERRGIDFGIDVVDVWASIVLVVDGAKSGSLFPGTSTPRRLVGIDSVFGAGTLKKGRTA